MTKLVIPKFKKKEVKGTSSPDIHIVVCKLMNDRTPVEVLEFDGLQMKDDNFNMFVVNEDMKFKEELEKKKHYILDHLHYKLDLSGLSREKKLEIVDEKIESIEQEILDCKKGKIPLKDDDGELILDEKGFPQEKKVNKIDLEVDLNHFKVLRYTVANDGEGSFEIINKDGKREMRFLARDGVFIPYFYRSDSDKGTPLSMHPDVGLGRKYHKEIDDRIEAEYLRDKNDSNFFSGMKGLLITIAIVGLVLALIIVINETNKRAKGFDEELAQCHAKIGDGAYYYTQLIKEELINRSIDVSKPATEEKKTTGRLSDLTGKIIPES